MNTRYYKHKLENLIIVNKIVTIHYFRFDKRFCSPTESHDFWELVYADKNDIICYADGKETILKEGEMIFHKPNELHSLRANGLSSPDVFIVSFECKSEAVRFFENRKIKIDKGLIKFIYAVIEESKKTFDLPYNDPYLKKIKLKKKPALGGQQVIKNYLELLLVSLMREETDKKNPEAIFLPREEFGERVAEQVIAFLKDNLNKKLQISDVCQGVHYNKSYVCKQFKQATGHTVIAYFTFMKIEKAKRLLQETDLSVSQIADTLNFDTPNYFSKTFKKLTGFTPLQYKSNRI